MPKILSPTVFNVTITSEHPAESVRHMTMSTRTVYHADGDMLDPIHRGNGTLCPGYISFRQIATTHVDDMLQPVRMFKYST